MTLYERLKAAGDASSPGRLFKTYLTEIKAVEGAEQQYRFTISTQRTDRDRDEIKADGWELSNYLKNPVVLWAHDYRTPPIAVARSIEVTADGLVSIADFSDTSKITELARTVDALIRVGALRATSVGFNPIKWNFDEERRGVDFVKQELLEYSIVPVPANAECLIEARSAGVDAEPLREWAAKTLEALDGGKNQVAGFWAQLEKFGQALDALGTKVATISIPPVSESRKSDEPAPDDKGVAAPAPPAGDPADAAGDTKAAEPVPVDAAGGADAEVDVEKIAVDDPDVEFPVDRADLTEALKSVVESAVTDAIAKARGRID